MTTTTDTAVVALNEFLRGLHPDGYRCLRAFRADKQTTEVHTILPPADNVGAVKQFANQYHERLDVYVGVAIRNAQERCDTLHCLYADLDFKDVPEPEARHRLTDFPLRPSVVVASGGGLQAYWLLYAPLHLQNGGSETAKRLLQRLATALGADLGAAEPARILRVPGTRNHKYDPPRPVILEALNPSLRYTLTDFESLSPQVEGDGSAGESQKKRSEPLPKVVDQNRNVTLTREAGRLRRLGWEEKEIATALLTLNESRCQPPLEEREVRDIAYNVAKYPAGETGAGHRSVKLTFANTITPRPVHWLWQERLALGSFGLLAGREGIGKTTVAYTLVADITRGRLEGVYNGKPHTVIVAATEDSWEHTIVPRLMAADADLARVGRVDVTSSDGITTMLTLPRDNTALEQIVQQEQAALILLDPLISRLDSKLDTHKDADVRRALEPLAQLADQTNAVVLGIIHVNKGSSHDPLNMVMGSRAFTAVARSVLFVAENPEDESTRVLGQAKNNLGRADLPTLTFEIENALVATTSEGEIYSGRVVWTGETTSSIRDVVEVASMSSENRTASKDAADWLLEYLQQHRGVADSQTIKTEGKKAGHSESSLKHARKKLRVGSESVGFPRRTWWTLPGVEVDLAAMSEEPSFDEPVAMIEEPVGPETKVCG
jgi:hypothetical protein